MAADFACTVSDLERSVHAGVVVDPRDNVTYVNPAFVRMWGYHSADQVLGRPFREFWRDCEAVQCVLDELPSRGRWEGALEPRHNDGSTFQVYAVMAWARAADGQAVGLTGCFMRMTETAEPEDELRRARELVSAAAGAAELLRGLSGQLALINRHGRQLLDRMRCDDPAREDVERILLAAEQADLLAGDIRAFEK